MPCRLRPGLLSLSAELSSSLLALSPLFPPSGRLSAELSSSSLACCEGCVRVHKLRILARHVLCAVVEAGGHPYHLSWMPNDEGSG